MRLLPHSLPFPPLPEYVGKWDDCILFPGIKNTFINGFDIFNCVKCFRVETIYNMQNLRQLIPVND